ADLERCIASGGVALFPADTVYGLACDPESKAAVGRLYEIKGRPPERPAAVMFFRLEDALAELPWLGERTRAAFERLLPGPFTLIVTNPEHRFPLACGPVPEKLGVRVPEVPQLRDVRVPVLQSSANPSGGRDARRLSDVDERIRAQVDLELDGGELPGTPSTVIDLGQYESGGDPAVLREGAVPAAGLARLL
ncbi:MAG TPA: L-threonylcarbamoyladenylate synthase, partial [Thermoleophilaceae bacterium]|nr:L-threonylcarbamoyladenylate synthase [Thermoleophilaceae bacterium]